MQDSRPRVSSVDHQSVPSSILSCLVVSAALLEQGGQDGKDGRSDKHEIVYAGSFPRYTEEFLGAYVIADGSLTLPPMADVQMGMWCYIKTFSSLQIDGLVEPMITLTKEGAKFVVIHFGSEFKWTRMA